LEKDPPILNRVDGYDLISFELAFGAKLGDPRWNPAADLDGNGIVDGMDLTILAFHFGELF
jgi:hypothetical protein